MGSLDRPAICVVIPTFNRLEMLRRAVDSVLAEQRVPLLLRIFDNASTDGTGEWAAALAAENPRVEHVRHRENIGVLANYAAAMASVASEFFVPLADDDWLLPDFLFDAHALLLEHPEAAAAAFVGEHRSAVAQAFYPDSPDDAQQGFLTPAEHMRDFLTYGHYFWSAVLWRRRTLDLVDPWETGRTSDVYFQSQVFARCPVVVKNQVGGVFTSHGHNNSSFFEPTDAVAWDLVFRRMDEVVRQERLFTVAEYLPLRDLFVARYRGQMARGVDHDLDPELLLQTAGISGFTFGDWQSAHAYLERFDQAKPEPEHWSFRYFPGIVRPYEPTLVPVDPDAPQIAELRWLSQVPGRSLDMYEHLVRQDTHITVIEARVHELQAALDARQEQLKDVRGRLRSTRGQLKRARRELTAIRASRSWRLAQRLARLGRGSRR